MMCKIRQIFIHGVFILSFIALLSTAVISQSVPDYLFLEVLDSNNKPVEGASVETPPNGFSSSSGGKQLTDKKGTTRFYLPYSYGYYNLTSIFTVSKDGYFTYHDFGGVSAYPPNSNAKIELLKIPQNKKERKVVGSEQIKREFMWAAKTGDVNTVNKLLKNGINPNLKTGDLRGVSGRKDIPAIVLAASSGNAETVETFIKAGVSVRSEDEPIHSILIRYLRADPFFRHKPETEAEKKEILRLYEKGVEILLNAGADFDVLEQEVRTPLMIAAEKGYTRAVKLLLDRGFSIYSKDSQGKSLFEYAADGDYNANNTTKVDTVNFLLGLGVNPNQNCGAALKIASQRGDIEVIKTLLNNGAEVNPKCDNSFSPLLLAVQREQVEAAKTLIEAEANINVVNGDGDNALMIAAKNNNGEMVKMLLDNSFQVNYKKPNGLTALFFSVENYYSSRPEALNFLLKAGANPNVIAQSKNSDYCSSPLIIAANRNFTELLKLLVANAADVNLACSNGNTTLTEAIRRYKPETVKQLIELGADVNGEKIDETINLIKTFYKEGDYERKYIDETIKLIEDARGKNRNN